MGTPKKPVKVKKPAKKIAPKKLNSNTAFSNSIIESLPGIFYIFDHSGKFLKWNNHFKKVMGFTTNEAGQKKTLNFFEAQAKQHIAQQKKRPGQTESDETLTNKKGEEILYRFTANNIEYNQQQSIVVNGTDITAYQNSKSKLGLSEKTLNGLFDNALGMAILSLKRKWIKVNQKLCDMLGYTEKEMLSMTYDDIADPIHKKENEETYRKFEKRMIGSYISERIFVKKDKTNVWVNITMSLIEDNGGAPIYYISQIEDITEKKKGLKELSDYKIALDESSIVAITDPKCIINYVNDNYCKIAGHKCEDLVGKGYSIINSDCNPPDHLKELLATISKGKIWHGDLCDIAKDGTIYWIENTIVPFLNDKGKPWQYVAIGSNITDRINAEHQREKMLEDIVQRNKDLEQFAYIVSHNLRSPLANIMGFTEELKQKTNTEEQNQLFLDYLAVSVNKLDTVINDLNNILQVKHQVNELKETISLTQVLQDTETMLSNIIDSQDIKIKSDFSAIDEIKTIKSYLYSIFYNLITNSIKYRRSTVKSTIHIKSKTLPGFIILTFKDNGMGIDMAKQGENLFGLYKRFHTTVAEGKGVGLYITKTQIESIGGKIKVTSKVNSGTEFSIQLPL